MGKDRDIRILQRRKANKVTVKQGIPHTSEGNNGDITLRNTSAGHEMFAKINGLWYGTPLTRVPGSVKSTLSRKIITEGGGKAPLTRSRFIKDANGSGSTSKLTKGKKTRLNSIDNIVYSDRRTGNVRLHNTTESVLSPKIELISEAGGTLATHIPLIQFVRAPTAFSDSTCDTVNGDATITHDANSRIVAGLKVSGPGVNEAATIASITDSTHFELSHNIDSGLGSVGTNKTLYFTSKNKIIDENLIGGISFLSNDSHTMAGNVDYGSIIARATDITNGSKDSELVINTFRDNSAKSIYFRGDRLQFGATGYIEDSSGVLSLNNETAYGLISKTGEPLYLYLHSDAGEDNADKWLLKVTDGGVLSLGNRIGGVGYDIMLSITPHATVTSSTTTIAGILKIGGAYIKDSGGNNAIKFDGSNNISIGGDLAVEGFDIILGTSSSGTAEINPKASTHDAVGNPLVVSSGNTTSGTTDNIAGGNLTFIGGQGKGSGAGGDIIFKVADGGSSGSTLNIPSTALTINDDRSAVFNRTIKAPSTFVLSGDIDPIANTRVDGSDSPVYLSEVRIGDRITVSGETRTVVEVTSDTRLFVDVAFSDNANDTTPDLLPACLVVTDSSDEEKFIVGDTGEVTIRADEGANASLIMRADEGDDAGDSWQILGTGGGTNILTIGNDLALKGTFVNALELAGNATSTSQTATFAGRLKANGGSMTVTGIEGGAATLLLTADESDDNGDDWNIVANDGGKLGILNDVSGSDVEQMTMTPNATLVDGIIAINTTFQVASGISQIKELSSSPTHLASHGTLWVKNDAPTNLYYEDDAGNDFLLNNTPGTILGYTHLNPLTQAEQAATTSLETIHDDAKVTFVTPQSEVVRIDFQAWLEEGTSAASTILGLSTANKTDGYATVNARFENIVNYGNRGDVMLTMSWVVSSAYLEAIGSTNNIWVGFKATSDESIWWGGHGTGRFPAMIITATAL